MDALDQLRGAGRKVGALPKRIGRAVGRTGGVVGRVRDNPWIAVGIAGGVVLLIAWIGWAIYVANEHGASVGLGVVIAWPAMLAALALISVPFVGAYLLLRERSSKPGSDREASEEEDSTGESAEAGAEEDAEPEAEAAAG